MKKRGFTLVELLVVIMVIGILASLLVPAVAGALQKGRDAKSASNLRQIGVALNEYASDHNNLYPCAHADVSYQPDGSDPSTWPWQQQIDDYVGGDRRVFKSPSLTTADYGYYLGSRAALLDDTGHATKPMGPVNRLRIKELSKHILGGECVYWTGSQTDADKDDYSQTPSFQEDGSKGKFTPILFADGHVQSCNKFDLMCMTARYEGVGIGNTYPWESPP